MKERQPEGCRFFVDEFAIIVSLGAKKPGISLAISFVLIVLLAGSRRDMVP